MSAAKETEQSVVICTKDNKLLTISQVRSRLVSIGDKALTVTLVNKTKVKYCFRVF